MSLFIMDDVYVFFCIKPYVYTLDDVDEGSFTRVSAIWCRENAWRCSNIVHKFLESPLRKTPGRSEGIWKQWLSPWGEHMTTIFH